MSTNVGQEQPPVQHCTMCGSPALEDGFVSDFGQGAQGFARWIPGPLERGLFGGAKVWSKSKFEIVAKRCSVCSHLELFVGELG